MSDFLIRLNSQYDGRSLLSLVKKPYGKRSPEGRFFSFPWGSVAVLEEHLARNENIITRDSLIFAWVGDLVTDMKEDFLESFINRLAYLQNDFGKVGVSLETDELFEKLNGAFAIVLANTTSFCIISDPLSFVPVYIGRDENNEIVSLGTHPDLVACITGKPLKSDLVSLAEFLNSGNCTFPNTMYTNVKEMNPGSLHITNITENQKATTRDFIYWSLPEEIHQPYDENELAEELRHALLAAVADRCDAGKAAVLLSGGLDSRAIMAAVPKSVECFGLTFCDRLNRETMIASRVAKCYDRDWVSLVRGSEFLGNSIVDVVKFTGCEFEWVNAHNAGFVDEIARYDVDFLLSGQQFDAYLKTLFAPDMVPIRRMRGILPTRYEKRSFDYADNLADFWKQRIVEPIGTDVYNRRKRYYEENVDENRSSVEWLNVYPFSQDREGAYWVADRRVLPLRLVAADRRILDFAFKCPVELKLNNRIFLKAALGIYGRGASIPCANDSVRPNSGYWLRAAQVVARKFQNRTSLMLQKLGKKPKVQHSWSDYQTYWEESDKLTELIQEYGKNISEFDAKLFKRPGRGLLKSKQLRFEWGFRLLQLAIWRHIVKDYRQYIKEIAV